MALGHTVDMGYMQVNTANLAKLGHTVEDMFDPCMNLKAGSAILSAAYAMALPLHKNEQAALQAALSAYNTGSFQRGFDNGYVARYINVPRVPERKALNPYAAETSVWSQP
jgi:type IV secretion system protein VirB1